MIVTKSIREFPGHGGIESIDPGQGLPSTPENIRWNSPAHLTSLKGTRMSFAGRLLIVDSQQSAKEGAFYYFAPMLPQGTEPRILATAMSLSFGLSYERVSNYGNGILTALYDDLTSKGSEFAATKLGEIHNHADEIRQIFVPLSMSNTDHMTSGIMLEGLEKWARENPSAAPKTNAALTESLKALMNDYGLRERGYDPESMKQPFASLLSLVRRNVSYVLTPFNSPEEMEAFGVEYWEALYTGYILHLRHSLDRAQRVIDRASRGLGPMRQSDLSIQEGIDAMKAWGVGDANNPTEVEQVMANIGKALEMVEAIDDRGDHFGPSSPHVSLESLLELWNRSQEYNLEWALASMEWEKYPVLERQEW